LKLLWAYFFHNSGEQWVYNAEQHVCSLSLETDVWERKMGHLSEGTWSFDLTGNDRLMPAVCINAAFDHYFQSMVIEPDLHARQLIEFLRLTTVNTQMILGDEWYDKEGGNPSGMPNTIWLNTIVRQCSFETVCLLEGIPIQLSAARYCGDDAIIPSIPGRQPEEVCEAYAKHTPWIEKIEGITSAGVTAHFVSRQTIVSTKNGVTSKRPYYVAPMKQLVSVFCGSSANLS
jgi:hypothetical protein